MYLSITTATFFLDLNLPDMHNLGETRGLKSSGLLLVWGVLALSLICVT
jgi:hypothetical protein